MLTIEALGRSDKPHDIQKYAMSVRVADAVAILDELGIGRAHFIGTSYTKAIKKRGTAAFVEALEKGGDMRLPEPQREEYLKNDPAAVAAASDAMLAEGAIAHVKVPLPHLCGSWRC